MASDFDESVYWAEFEAAGMLTPAVVVNPGESAAVSAMVQFRRPDVALFVPGGQVVSREYVMEYQFHDFPRLVEDAKVLIGAAPLQERFRVRYDPQIPDGNPHGFFRIAVLSRDLTP